MSSGSSQNEIVLNPQNMATVQSSKPSHVAPLRLVDSQNQPQPDDLTPMSDLESYYYGGDSDEEEYYTDIYDSSHGFMETSEPDDFVPSAPNTGDDLRNLFVSNQPSVNNQVVSALATKHKPNEHFFCGKSPQWFPYSTNNGQRSCCNGKTYDTSILMCCEDGNIRSSC